jgi:hypothetical protein
MKKRDIPNDNQIQMFFHCGLCLTEIKKIVEREGSCSPRDYARLSIGFTPLGIQVWCNRHECNVAHIDFQGQTHPANTSRPKGEGDN